MSLVSPTETTGAKADGVDEQAGQNELDLPTDASIAIAEGASGSSSGNTLSTDTSGTDTSGTDRSSTGTSGTGERVAGQTANLILRQAVLVLMALGANIIAARTLAPEGRGALAFALQAAYMVSFAILLGTEKAVAVVIPGEGIDRGVPAIWSTTWKRTIGVAVVGLLALLIVWRSQPESEAWVYLAPVGLMGIASAVSRSLETSAVNANRSQVALVNTAGASFLTLLAVIALAIAGITNPSLWLVAYGVAALSVGLGLCLTYGKVTPAQLRRKDRSDTTRLLASTGYRLFPASLASYAAYRSDRLVLPVLAGNEALGLYVVVVALTDIVAAPVEALSQVVQPRWRKAHLAGNFKPGKFFGLALIYLALACTAAVFIGRIVLVPIFGEAYEPAKELLPTLAVGSALYSVGRLAAAWRLAAGYVGLASTADLVGMAFAVISYFALIPGLGAQGAALGSIIGYGATIVALVVGTRWIDPSTQLEGAAEVVH